MIWGLSRTEYIYHITTNAKQRLKTRWQLTPRDEWFWNGTFYWINLSNASTSVKEEELFFSSHRQTLSWTIKHEVRCYSWLTQLMSFTNQESLFLLITLFISDWWFSTHFSIFQCSIYTLLRSVLPMTSTFSRAYRNTDY